MELTPSSNVTSAMRYVQTKKVCHQIKNTHEKCTLSRKSLKTHNVAVKKKAKPKHLIERDSSMKNRKKKKKIIIIIISKFR